MELQIDRFVHLAGLAAGRIAFVRTAVAHTAAELAVQAAVACKAVRAASEPHGWVGWGQSYRHTLLRTLGTMASVGFIPDTNWVCCRHGYVVDSCSKSLPRCQVSSS